jgi:hypothetical protein
MASNPPLPPPGAYIGWVDFAVETFDAKGSGLPLAPADGSGLDPETVREAARQELRALRAAQAPPPDSLALDWDRYRALREQLTHEDNLVNHRLMWLILSEGLLFTAYGTISTAKLHWLAYGFPFFGMTVATVIGASIYAALAATEALHRHYAESGLSRLCRLTPSDATDVRGKWAAQALPFVFGALWMLAIAGAFNG